MLPLKRHHKRKHLQMHSKQSKLFEGLRAKDLKDLVDNIFTVDRYKSKMGEDKDIVVLGFRVTDKYPATDLMEFIEKGYSFILDADISTGEERDGKYQVFVELERSKNISAQIKDLLEGISQLCDQWDWKFRYSKDIKSLPASEENILEHIPSSAEEYENKILEYTNKEIGEFFDQSPIDEIIVDSQNNITFKKPFSGELTAKLISSGFYEDLKDTLSGGIQLDENSRNQTVFLEKYLGNYEINKLNNMFLIKNKDKAVILQKDRW